VTHKYNELRDWPSGPNGLTKVPAHWSTGSLRNFASFRTGWTPPTSDDSAYVGPHPWANISDLAGPWIDSAKKSLSGEAVVGHEPCEPGDVLFAFKLSVGATARASVPMYTNEAIATFGRSEHLDPAYAVYALPEFVPLNANTNIYGAKLLNSSLIKSAPIALPPLPEQRAIADYLDRETAQIDTLIEEQEKLLVLARERFRAVARRALTPGSDWDRVRIKHIGTTSLGKMLDGGRAKRDGDRTVPYVRAADVLADGSINLGDLNEMPFSEPELAALDLRTNDILLIEGGATVGRPGFLRQDTPGIAFQKTVNRLRVEPGADPRFVYWALEQLYESNYYANHFGSVSFVHLTGEKLREIPVALPPLERQRELATEIDRAQAILRLLVTEAESFIELSRERRAALITAAVTGQIDVGAAA
jgi:type I restriction enzyme S subunit